MTTRERLVAARNLIAHEQRWTQGAYARNAAGVAVAPTDPAAVCWCPLGALIAAGPLPTGDAVRLLRDVVQRDRLCDHVGVVRVEHAAGTAVSMFNDTHTHGDALAAFDRAIGKAVTLEEADGKSTDPRA